MRKLERVSPELRDLLLSLIEEVERTVTKEEFNELKEIVGELAEAQRETGERLKELAEAQRRTEERVEQLAEAQRKTEEGLARLERTVEELAEAQKKTEERLKELAEAQRETEERLTRLERPVEELAEAQKRTEERLTRLERTVEQLAEAQRRTEKRVEELAEAQKKTEERVEQLIEAQRRTEEEIRKLAIGQRRLREQVGGLSRSVAYALENEAYRNLPRFLRDRYGIEVTDRLVRFELKGEEINLFARARKDGKDVVLVGEAVLRLDDRGKLRQIKRKVDLVSEEYGIEVVPVVVTHFATERLLEEAHKAGFLVVQTFEWQ